MKDFCRRAGITEETINRILYEPEGYNAGRLTRYAQDFYAILTCLGICEYRHRLFDMDLFADIYSTGTGINMSASEIIEAGERIWNLFRAINVREGFRRRDDRIPPRWFEPLKTNNGVEIRLRDVTGKSLSHEDVEALLDDYYKERGWEVETGIPSKQKLTDLGLTNVVEDFKRLGIFEG